MRDGARVVATESDATKRDAFSFGIQPKENGDIYPLELIAAAHASSFSLALSKELGLKTAATGEISATATVTTEKVANGWEITNIHLTVAATLPKISQAQFIDATVRAKTNCMVSKILHANVSMTAKLEKPDSTTRSKNSPTTKMASANNEEKL
jgi:osmotically inducible protein OsmC